MNNNLKELSSGVSITWREKAEYRRQNKWLEYSSQIARRIIAIIRNRDDLNQAKLAEIVGVTAQQISKIVKGQENMTLETIYKLSQALGVELIGFPEYEFSQIFADTTAAKFEAISGMTMTWSTHAHHLDKPWMDCTDFWPSCTNFEGKLPAAYNGLEGTILVLGSRTQKLNDLYERQQ